MELTPEQRRKIYDEEEARIQAEKLARLREERPVLVSTALMARSVIRWFLLPEKPERAVIATVLVVLLIVAWAAVSSRRPESVPSAPAAPVTTSPEVVPQENQSSSPLPAAAVPKKRLVGTLAGEVAINPIDGAKMVWVPAGEFTRGSTDAEIASAVRISPAYTQASWCDSEKPQRKIYLDGYWIYKYEVTAAQYRRFCKATGKAMPELLPGSRWKNDRPIDNVTWQDSADYAAWAGASLPTEAQWEKAARGTGGRIYPWGNRWNASRCANSVKREPDGPSAVGRYPNGASPYGCLDMAGNAIEWCADWYDEDGTYYATAPKANPEGPAEGRSRVLRGGSWDILSASPLVFRCAARGGADPEKGLVGSQGFRCVGVP